MDPSQGVPMMQGSSRSRPGVQEKRTDAEPRVYCELPSYPSFNEPIPPEVSLEEICIRYPNHLRGSHLDAFIQWHWSATDMYSCLSDIAINEFKSFGITTCKSFANRANFLMKRLDARLSALSAEEVTALCTAPKIRTCMMDGTERYGASKLQGKFHNPMAPVVRTYPHRQAKVRRPLRPSPSTRTFVHNDKEYPLWGSAEELEEYKTSMATYWGYQRARAEQIIGSDALYGASQDHERNRLILKITNWPCNTGTETFFSFQHVQNCPAFVNAICNMVTAAVTDMLDSFPAEDSTQQLHLARQSAVSYVLVGQAARLARLNDFLSSLRLGEPTCGLVDQALSWTTEINRNSTGSASPHLDPGNSHGEDIFLFDQSSLESDTVPLGNVALAPFSKTSKRTKPESADTAKSIKRVRFADSTTELGQTDLRMFADFHPEETYQYSGSSIVWPEPDLDEPNTTRVINGDDVVFTLEPPMDEILEAFNMESLPGNPLRDSLDADVGLMVADYSIGLEEDDSEWAKLLLEVGQDEGLSNMDESGIATSWELPELVDNDGEWLKEAIGRGPGAQSEFS